MLQFNGTEDTFLALLGHTIELNPQEIVWDKYPTSKGLHGMVRPIIMSVGTPQPAPPSFRVQYNNEAACLVSAHIEDKADSDPFVRFWVCCGETKS